MDSTTARGYGATHQRERAKWEPKVKAGGINCARCQEPIPADAQWDLGHNDDRTGYIGPEHVKCNRGAGARNATAVRLQKQQTISRDW
ncbi:HNH endonuclease [Arthrobacter phage Shoya]|uniref:HNH endonuclease n=1 Tax=Arthrobacter phage Shoya TaxID=2704035 RepID=A0A6G6XI16_9CAUD|nr:HNH endonuclease [Arthrobacter phage Shoya]QIG57738.1 HNH endonuclease [Arthrobacter phage Shoya]